MKIAIVHDELMRRGGAEQVVKCFHQAFPEAPIYTMVYQPNLTYPEFKNMPVRTSWFQKIVKTESSMKNLFFPVGLLAMKQLDVTSFDVVLISSTYCAKYVKISKQALVINYCYTPFRLAWNPQSYAEFIFTNGLKKMALTFIIKILKKVDYQAAQRTDFFIAMTEETKQRIIDTYKPANEIAIIKPPVNCSNYYVSETTDHYFLVVSRLEYYKKVDLVVDAFNTLNYPLLIVGRGSQEEELKRRANKNIVFRSGLSSTELAEVYSKCKAFIFPQYEDYGITPLEANASGRPVIAYGKGGIMATMIPYAGDGSQATALFFKEQTAESLIRAVQKFNTILDFNPEFIRAHAEKFDEPNFISSIRKLVTKKYTSLNHLNRI